MTLSARDAHAVWHPYTQHQTAALPVPIIGGVGAYLIDDQGRKYLDLISSWWVNLHGHCQPEIAKAIYEQAMTLEHVLFAGFTHEPAIELAEKLLQILPAGYSKVFYSDNGSTAIEVALKMAYQYWVNKAEPKRKRFMSFEKSYHGDTFGAMAMGKESGFFSVFSELLFPVDMFSYPATWLGDEFVEEKENKILIHFQMHLDQWGDETAALMIEPLVQGASGMHMCSTRFLKKLEALVRSYGILIIYDEAVTGFGRTGDNFACSKAHTQPDIICLAKGITGGFLPLAATVCHERIYAAFLGDSYSKALIHGHSFTGNPLGCAAALASITLLKSAETQLAIRMIEEVHQEALQELMEIEWVEKPRYCGTIAAFDLKIPAVYGSSMSLQLRNRFVEKGLLIRPLGNVIYMIPPYCITVPELRNAYNIIIQEMEGAKLCTL